jgi:hypothetical protein
MSKLAFIWRQMTRYGVFNGLLRGIVLPATKSSNFGKLGLKKAKDGFTDDEIDYELNRDHVLDAAWAAGELELMVYEDR